VVAGSGSSTHPANRELRIAYLQGDGLASEGLDEDLHGVCLCEYREKYLVAKDSDGYRACLRLYREVIKLLGSGSL
jgi:hypothetical protein